MSDPQQSHEATASEPTSACPPPARERLPMVTVYDHPSDYPDEYIARRFTIDDGQFIGEAEPCFRAKSISAIERQLIAMGLTRMPNTGDSDIAIVSVWT